MSLTSKNKQPSMNEMIENQRVVLFQDKLKKQTEGRLLEVVV